MITYEDIKKNEEIKIYVEQSNRVLGEVGITEHGPAHVTLSAERAAKLLEALGYDERTCELARIAGYMHDIGNLVNRVGHAQSGALMAFEILTRLGMPPKETAEIAAAIGHHDEKTAAPVSPIAAALILADKSDVRRTRVRRHAAIAKDIHDRVNFAVHTAELEADLKEKLITLKIEIDTAICPVMDYFEIFLERMVLCRRAAERLGLDFVLIINNTRLL